MKIIVTGISGFLGSHLAKQLINTNHEVTGIVHQNVVEISGAKLLTFEELKKQSIDPDVLIFCHAAIPVDKNSAVEDLRKVNVDFTREVSNLYPKAFKIYTSSVSVYNLSIDCLTENSPTKGINLYGESKLEAERVFDENAAIIRISSMFGPGMKENTILPIFVKQAIEKAQINIFGDGTRKQNYVPVEQVIHYIEKIIVKKAKGIFLATGKGEISNFELGKLIGDYCGAELIFQGEDNNPSFCFSNEQSRKRLGIQAEFEVTSYIKQYIDWKQKQY